MKASVFYGYGLGHTFSDLLSHVYFSYFILYLNAAVGISDLDAAWIILIGQVCDGIATPLFGIWCDRASKLETADAVPMRKRIHFGGFLTLVVFSFFLYGECWVCRLSGDSQFAVIVLLASIIQIAYAAVEVSYLSIVPFLAQDNKQRIKLVSISQLANTVTGIIVYISVIILSSTSDVSNGLIQSLFVIAALLGIPSIVLFYYLVQVEVKPHHPVEPTEDQGEPPIGHEAPECQQVENQILDDAADRNITPLIRGFKGATAASFTASQIVNEESENEKELEETSSGDRRPTQEQVTEVETLSTGNELQRQDSTLAQWFQKPAFYFTAMVYLGSRLGLLFIQIYTPIFLRDQFGIDSAILGSIPLVQYLASVVAIFATPALIGRFGRKWTYFLGSCSVLVSAVLFNVTADDEELIVITIYIFSSAAGVGTMVCLITSISLIAELVNHSGYGAMIYGLLGLLSKASTGIVLVVFFMIPELPVTAVLGYFPMAVLWIGVVFMSLVSLSADE